jgi:two-component system cell cycle sensor histidine kinase/response regulator CckA
MGTHRTGEFGLPLAADTDFVAISGVATTFAPRVRAGGGALRRLLVDRWMRVLVIGGLIWLVGYAVATALVRGEHTAMILSDVVYPVPVALAAGLMIWAAVRAPYGQRALWWLLAVSMVCWLGGELTWAVLELGLHRQPFPSVADVFYLATYAAAIPAVVLGFGAGLRARLWRAMLDASALATALGVSGWVLLIEPQLDYGPSLATVIGIVYPLLDVAVLMLIAGIAYAARRSVPMPVALVAAGFALAAVADTAYTYAAVTGVYGPGSWLDLGWQLEALLLAVAALRVVRGYAGSTSERAPRDHGLPLILAGTGVALAVVAIDLVNGTLSAPIAALGVFAVGSVVARLVIASREQQRLVAALEARSRMLSVQARALESTLTRHEHAERELEHTVSVLQATLESTADGILVVDNAGRIVGSNSKFRELWRIPDEVMAGGDDEAALAYVLEQLADPDAFVAKVKELYANPEAESFDTLEFRDGRLFERFSQPHMVAGESVGRVWSFRDVTERSRLEQELGHAQKMEAVGRLAGGIAHDFNNLLTAIIGYSDLLLGKQDEAGARKAAEEIKYASERAASLTSQLLSYSRKQILQPKVVDLNTVVQGMAGLLRPLLGARIELTIYTAAKPTLVRVDPGRIEQVVANLVINARDAMPTGGRIELETGLEADGHVLLRVRDSGQGMDETTLERAFEPFFTTKPLGEGTGLGLSTVLGIVEQSGGRVAVDSRPGVGTEFEIVLPAAPPQAQVAVASTPGDDPSVRAEGTILLVEDEGIVRELLGEVLAEAGYEVLAAASGEEALTVSESHQGPIELVLTDLVMPGLSGRELVERLGEARPEVIVVYMSGYTEDAIVRHGVREASATFLQKPFTLDDVLGTLAGLLAERLPNAA